MKNLAAVICLMALLGAASPPEIIQVGNQDLQQVIDNVKTLRKGS